MAVTPALAVETQPEWVEVDLDVPPAEWAGRASELILGRPGATDNDRVRRRLPRRLETVASALTSTEPDAAFVLCPPSDLRVRTAARLLTLELADGMTIPAARAAVRDLLSPPSDRVSGQLEVQRFWSLAGAAERIVVRLVDPDDLSVTEHVSYVWVFPVRGCAVVLTMAFTDSLEAGHWRAATDALAATLSIVG